MTRRPLLSMGGAAHDVVAFVATTGWRDLAETRSPLSSERLRWTRRAPGPVPTGTRFVDDRGKPTGSDRDYFGRGIPSR